MKKKKASMVLKGLGVAAATGLGVSMVRAATTYKPQKKEQSVSLEPENVDVEIY